MLEDTNDETVKNREAESAYARRKLWDEDMDNVSKSKPQADDMRQTVLGDLQTNNYVSNTPSQVGKILLGLGLLTTGIGGGTGAYFIADAIKAKAKDTAPVIVDKPKVPEEKSPAVKDTDTVIEWTLE